MTATLTSAFINAHLPEMATKTKPEDFIPGAIDKRPHFAPGVIPISPDALRAQWSANPLTKKA